MERFGVIGISHHSSTIEEIGLFAKDPGSLHDLREALGVDELARLTTCNRVELYYVSHEGVPADRILRAFSSYLHPDAPELQELADASGYALSGDDCVRHVDALLVGLESMVFGDEQIVGQFRAAMRQARDEGVSGPWLEMLADEALKFARRLRRQVDYERLPTSVAEVAADLLKGHLQGRGGRVVMVGAGETIRLLAARIAHWQDVELHFVNRGEARARALAQAHGGRAQALDAFRAEPVPFDALVSATAAREPVLTRSDLAPVARPQRPRLLLDLGVPADLDPELCTLPGFRPCDIVEIGRTARRHHEVAESIRRQVRPFLREATLAFRDKIFRRHITPVAHNLRKAVEERAELEAERWAERYLGHLDEADRELFRAFALRLADQTVQVPLVALRKTLRELPMGELLIERMREAGREAAKKTRR